MTRSIHPGFERELIQKQPNLQAMYHAARAFVLSLYPDANELLYHTQALTSVYSPSLKLQNAYCHIPFYTEHLNLGFNFGAQLDELANPALAALVEQAIARSLLGLGDGVVDFGRTASKIKQTQRNFPQNSPAA